MKITLIARPDNQHTGVGRYVLELKRGLLAQGHEVDIVNPIVPLPGWLLRWVGSRFGWDLYAFFNNYPILARYPKGSEIYHISSQNLASLLVFCPPPGITVVTVHDIVPHLGRTNRAIHISQNVMENWFDRLSIIGLGRAERLITVSEFTRDTLVASLGIPCQRIVVVHEGVLR